MYGITYIWVIFRANVGKYSIHGAYGYTIQCMGDHDNPFLEFPLTNQYTREEVAGFEHCSCACGHETMEDKTSSIQLHIPN